MTCSTVESFLGGKRSTESWIILKKLGKNENGGRYFNPKLIGKWEIYFKEFLTKKQKMLLGKARN
jgi:hypothetical protein